MEFVLRSGLLVGAKETGIAADAASSAVLFTGCTAGAEGAGDETEPGYLIQFQRIRCIKAGHLRSEGRCIHCRKFLRNRSHVARAAKEESFCTISTGCSANTDGVDDGAAGS